MSWVERFKMAPHPDYKISKAALNMLNQQYAMDLAEEGFTFLLVSPGVSKDTSRAQCRHVKANLLGSG